MHISKLTKNVLKYLPLVAVMVVTIIGMFIAKDLHQKSIGSQVKMTASVASKPDNPAMPIESAGTCTLPKVYTSLPAKCRTADGKFIQGDWSSSTSVLVPYELK